LTPDRTDGLGEHARQWRAVAADLVHQLPPREDHERRPSPRRSHCAIAWVTDGVHQVRHGRRECETELDRAAGTRTPRRPEASSTAEAIGHGPPLPATLAPRQDSRRTKRAGSPSTWRGCRNCWASGTASWKQRGGLRSPVSGLSAARRYFLCLIPLGRHSRDPFSFFIATRT